MIKYRKSIMIEVEELERQQELNASLCVDICCYICKRLVAMSNAEELYGKWYCNNCFVFPDWAAEWTNG